MGQEGLYGRLCGIWTAPLNKRRLSLRQVDGLFTPPPDLLRLEGTPGFRAAYLEEMCWSLREQTDRWVQLLSRPSVVLCCSCKDPAECQRRLLVDLLLQAAEQLGLPAIYCGETV